MFPLARKDGGKGWFRLVRQDLVLLGGDAALGLNPLAPNQPDGFTGREGLHGLKHQDGGGARQFVTQRAAVSHEREGRAVFDRHGLRRQDAAQEGGARLIREDADGDGTGQPFHRHRHMLQHRRLRRRGVEHQDEGLIFRERARAVGGPGLEDRRAARRKREGSALHLAIGETLHAGLDRERAAHAGRQIATEFIGPGAAVDPSSGTLFGAGDVEQIGLRPRIREGHHLFCEARRDLAHLFHGALRAEELDAGWGRFRSHGGNRPENHTRHHNQPHATHEIIHSKLVNRRWDCALHRSLSDIAVRLTHCM